MVNGESAQKSGRPSIYYDMSRRWEIFMLQLSLGADRDIKYAKNVFK